MCTGVLELDHVQVAAPPGCEAEARRFYGGVLGLEELPKPALLEGRGGCWFLLGDGRELHVGVEREFAPARKAHPGLRAGDLDALAARIGDVDWADPAELPGRRRFHCFDPFGNRLEFLE
jgi:catechol 2,3-dioxygenase-like lactoylglutathione lyase family enzyme